MGPLVLFNCDRSVSVLFGGAVTPAHVPTSRFPFSSVVTTYESVWRQFAGLSIRRGYRRTHYGTGAGYKGARHLAHLRDGLQGQTKTHTPDSPRTGSRWSGGRDSQPLRRPVENDRSFDRRRRRQVSVGPILRRRHE